MRIDEASRQTGLSRDMIRHYEKLGLIRPGRLANGYRDYTQGEVYRLTVIKYLSNLGVPLKVIAGAFDSGEAGEVARRLDGELDRLAALRSQIDARIAAALDSRACFGQYISGVACREYIAQTRYLLSFDEAFREADAARLAAEEYGGFFQFYFRQRYVCGEGVAEDGRPDRGLLLYDELPGSECVPAQRCLRAVLAHAPGRILSAEDLAPHLRLAARQTGKSRFTVLIHQFFSHSEEEEVVCAEILLGEE